MVRPDRSTAQEEITITGNGRLTRDVELRSTRSGKRVATVSVAGDRRHRQAHALFVDLVV